MKNKKLARILSVLATVALLASCVPVALAATTNPSWNTLVSEMVYYGSDARKEISKLVTTVDKGDQGTQVTLVNCLSGAAATTLPANSCYGWDSYSFDLTISDIQNDPSALYLALRYEMNNWLADGAPRSIEQLERGLGLKIDLNNSKLTVYRMKVHKGTNVTNGHYTTYFFWDNDAQAEAAKYYETTEFDFDLEKTHRFVIYRANDGTSGYNDMVITMDGVVIHKFSIKINGADEHEDDFNNVRTAADFAVLMGLNSSSVDASVEDAIQAKVLFNANPKKTATELSELITACTTKKDGVVDSEPPAVGQVKTAAKTEFAAAIATATTVANGTDQKEETLYPAMAALQAALAKFEKAVVKPVDTEALTEAIEYAEEALEMLGETAIGYADLKALVAEAKALLTNAATTPSDEGDAMVTALLEAADALELPSDEDDDFGGEDSDDGLGGADADSTPGADGETGGDPDVSEPVETGDSALAVVLSLVLCAAAAAALLLTKKRTLAE